jgi:hypothetical protein
VERKKIEEGLARIDSKLLKKGRSFDHGKSWLENAEDQQKVNPFRAILASANPREVTDVLVVDDLNEELPLWSVPREMQVPRTAADLSDCCAPLLRLSSEILFIDPHFNPAKIEYRRPLEQFLNILASVAPQVHRIEYHTECDPSKNTRTQAYLEDAAIKKLPSLIPAGLTIRVMMWKRREGGKPLHARYLLTELGGIRVDHGLDEGDSGETTDIGLLSNELHTAAWGDFQRQPEPTSFEFVGQIEIEGNAR